MRPNKFSGLVAPPMSLRTHSFLHDARTHPSIKGGIVDVMLLKGGGVHSRGGGHSTPLIDTPSSESARQVSHDPFVFMFLLLFPPPYASPHSPLIYHRMHLQVLSPMFLTHPVSAHLPHPITPVHIT